jgi:hypothetical protein
MKATKIAQELFQQMPGAKMPSRNAMGEFSWYEVYTTEQWRFCRAIAMQIVDEDRQLHIMAATIEQQNQRIERLERTLEDTRKLVQNHAISTSKTRTFNPTEVSA